MSRTLLLANKSLAGIVKVDSYTPFGHHNLCMDPCKIIDVARRGPFRILIVNESSAIVNPAAPQRVDITSLPPVETIHNDINDHYLYTVLHHLSKPVNVLPYMLAPVRLQ